MSMSEKTIQFRLGLISMVASLFLYFYAIPAWVDTPTNVPGILSPRLWVDIIAVVAFLTGILLVIASLVADSTIPSENLDKKTGNLRLIIVASVMVGIVYGIPIVGMVWIVMIGALIFSIVLRPKVRPGAIYTAIVLPLILYYFFSQIVGVTIPQGLIVSLP